MQGMISVAQSLGDKTVIAAMIKSFQTRITFRRDGKCIGRAKMVITGGRRSIEHRR